jgi:hypothetical protein
LALAAAKVAAHAVEERLFREFFGNVWTIAAVPSDRGHPALLLAVDSDLRILGADRSELLRGAGICLNVAIAFSAAARFSGPVYQEPRHASQSFKDSITPVCRPPALLTTSVLVVTDSRQFVCGTMNYPKARS